jgi:hypothetical protein
MSSDAMTTPPNERWRPLPTQVGDVDLTRYRGSYSVSAHPNRVRSDERKITHQGPWRAEFTRTIRTRILRPSKTGEVTLSAHNVPTTIKVDALVAAAFADDEAELS